MDAQSLHEHQTSVPPQRLGLKHKSHPVVEISGNDDIEPVSNHPEPPQKTAPDVEIMEVIEPVGKDEAPVVRGAEPSQHEKEQPKEIVEEPKAEPEAPKEDHPEPERPNPWTKESAENNEEDAPIYHYSSTSAIPEARHIRVEPAQPVRDNSNTIIFILLVAILIITVATYAVILTRNSNAAQRNGNSANQSQVAEEEVVGHEDVVGVWRSTSGNNCFVFDETDGFYWYQSCFDDASDYHYGHFVVKRGENALNQIGISYERAAEVSMLDKQNISLNDLYSLQLDTEYTKHNGEVRNNNLSKFLLLFVHTSDKNARAYNVDTNDPYYLIKVANNAEEWRANHQIESGTSGTPETPETPAEPVEEPAEQPAEQPSNQPSEQPSEQPSGQSSGQSTT